MIVLAEAAACRRFPAATAACIPDVPAAANAVLVLSPGVVVVPSTSAAVMIDSVPCQHVNVERVAADRCTPAAVIVDAAAAAAAAAPALVAGDAHQSVSAANYNSFFFGSRQERVPASTHPSFSSFHMRMHKARSMRYAAKGTASQHPSFAHLL